MKQTVEFNEEVLVPIPFHWFVLKLIHWKGTEYIF